MLMETEIRREQGRSRLLGIEPFEKKIWLSSPTMHGEELRYVTEAYEANWVSTVGENIDEVERIVAEKVGRKHCVALSSGTAALHLAVRMAGERLYGRPRVGRGALEGRKAFCSDLTFAATANPIAYEGGEAVFIDTEYDTWNMDPVALRRAFEVYPEVRLVVMAHLYGTPGKVGEIRNICDAHHALLIEDAAESFGASYQGRQTGSFGDYSVLSANGNKIVTGSSGGMLLTDSREDAERARKWSTQSREDAPWYQHEEIGYNYRMSNIVAGILRGQLLHLEEHIGRKRAIYERYREGLKDLPVSMNPYDGEKSEPNFWLSCLVVDREAMCRQVRGERESLYIAEKGRSCPTQILEALAAVNAEGRPIWKPMHLQPIYRMNGFITREGDGRAGTNAYRARAGTGRDGMPADVGMDIFERGLCLPSDVKMAEGELARVVEIIRNCFLL